MGRIAALLALVGGLALAARARAEELSIATVEHGDWPASVAALQTDGADGAVLHVVVRDGDTIVGCDRYALRLDEVGAAAFAVGACDASGATTLTLVSRHALFAHDDVVARPLAVGITAVEVRSVGARGGAGEQAGSTEHCTIDVHPYIVDPETHAQVALLAPRFAIRVENDGVEAVATPDGFRFQTTEAGNLTVAYDVVDTTDGRVVTSEHAELTCGGGPDLATPPAPPVIVPPVPTAPTPAPDDSRDMRFMLTAAGTFHWLEPGVFGKVPSGTMPLSFDGMAAGGVDAEANLVMLGDGLYIGADTQLAVGSAVGLSSSSTSTHQGLMLIGALSIGWRFELGFGMHMMVEMLGGAFYASLGDQQNTATYLGCRTGIDWTLFGRRGPALGFRFGYGLVGFESSDIEAAVTLTFPF